MIHAPGASGLAMPGVEATIRVNVGRVQMESEIEIGHEKKYTR
jgi:hypothetical protein